MKSDSDGIKSNLKYVWALEDWSIWMWSLHPNQFLVSPSQYSVRLQGTRIPHFDVYDKLTHSCVVFLSASLALLGICDRLHIKYSVLYFMSYQNFNKQTQSNVSFSMNKNPFFSERISPDKIIQTLKILISKI